MNFLPKILYTALFSVLALVVAPAAQAQINVNINAGPPAWGPPVPTGTQFYYIPEVDGFYDLNARQYIVSRNGRWVPVAALAGYDPYSFHPVVLDYRGRQPWVYVGEHRDRYPRRVIMVPNRRGLPPGQAKKMYREGYREVRQDDDRGYDHDDDRGRGNGNGHGKGKYKDKDRD